MGVGKLNIKCDLLQKKLMSSKRKTTLNTMVKITFPLSRNLDLGTARCCLERYGGQLTKGKGLLQGKINPASVESKIRICVVMKRMSFVVWRGKRQDRSQLPSLPTAEFIMPLIVKHIPGFPWEGCNGKKKNFRE